MKADGLRGEPVWVGCYEGWLHPRDRSVTVDRDGVRHTFGSMTEAEDELDQMDMLTD